MFTNAASLTRRLKITLNWVFLAAKSLLSEISFFYFSIQNAKMIKN